MLQSTMTILEPQTLDSANQLSCNLSLELPTMSLISFPIVSIKSLIACTS